MKTLRVWKIIGGLALLFALGGICGAALTGPRAGWTRFGKQRLTDTWSERWFAQMSERLELRDDQQQALRPMVAQLQQQLRELQQQTAARAGEIVRQNGKQMWEVLDEAQRAKYHQLQDEQKLHRAAAAAAKNL